VVVDCRHHELGEVHATRDVAVQNGVPYVPAPYRQTLAVALLKVAAAYDGPSRIAGKHTPASLHLVVEVGEASETCERAEDRYDRFEFPRTDVLAVPRDVPPAREHKACSGTGVVEHCLGCPRRIMVYATWDQHREHPVALRYGAPDDLGVVRRSGNDRDAPLERVELLHALFPT